MRIRQSSKAYAMRSSWLVLSRRTSASMPDRCTRGQAGVSRTENLSVGNDNGDRTSLSASPRSRAAVEVSCECSGRVSGRC